MKVLHILTYSTGGAAKAAIRQHEALLSIGVDSKILVLINNLSGNSNTNITEYNGNNSVSGISYIKQKIKERFYYKKQNQLLKKQINAFDLFSLVNTPYELYNHPMVKEADVINLHWVSNFLNFITFFKHCNKPIVWTLHDMNPFTGGCHYSNACEKYKHSCINCPQLDGTDYLNLSKKSLQHKKEALYKKTSKKLTIVSPSEWLKNCSENSTIFKPFNHKKISHSIPFEIFKPLDLDAARKALGIDISKTTLLFAAENINNKRKGFKYLNNVLQSIDSQSIQLISMGGGEADLNNKNYLHLGSIADERLMAIVYSAADAFIFPSVEENVGLVMLESLACGTPVIGFSIGGIKEVIMDGVNGYLCGEPDDDNLNRGIKKFIQNKLSFNRSVISKNCRELFSPQKQANAFLDLYTNM